MSHTPGPWKIMRSFPATVWAGDEEKPRIISDRSATDAEEIANARLIAAAPDLLEALKLLHNEVKGSWSLGEPSIRSAIGNTNYSCVERALEQARAAINAATGDAEGRE